MDATVLTPSETNNTPNEKVSTKMPPPTHLGTIVAIFTLLSGFLILVYTIWIAPLREDISDMKTELKQDISDKFEEQRVYFESLIDRLIAIQQQNN